MDALENILSSLKRSKSLWFTVDGNGGHLINDGGGKVAPETFA